MLSFNLSEEFVNTFKNKNVKWGFPIGSGNSLGEITFLRTYSRKKEDGTKETWAEVVRRCVEGCYTIQKDWCLNNRVPWDEAKAQRSAEEMYQRMFEFKFTPPGRGLWMMRTEFVHKNNNSAALQNCAFVSTDDIFKSMAFLMEASMLGVGVGFDTRGAGRYMIQSPTSGQFRVYVVPDTREGWYESTVELLETYLTEQPHDIFFDYSKIRGKGEPIRGFGGTAAGPQPLVDLHEQIRQTFRNRDGEELSTVDVVDIANLIGKCVVSGNVRRSAEIALGEPGDENFKNLKNYEAFPQRNDWETGWGWSSNNSIIIREGDKIDWDEVVEAVDSSGGEPGVFWLDVSRQFGRMQDPANDADYRAMGTNPCGEQTLESYECCNLVETFPSNHVDHDDYMRTLKYAYLFAKTVTLMPTHWEETNAVMQRNRRIGLSMTGQVDFAVEHGWSELSHWMDCGYDTIRHWDNIYSEWLCVRESNKVTSVKPSGTVSLLAGVSPGVHWPVESSYIRRIRFASSDPVAMAAVRAGYEAEPAANDPNTTVVSFPVHGKPALSSEKDVSVWQKVAAVVNAQRYWADNQVSATITYSPEEKQELSAILAVYENQLKSLSFLPLFDGSYPQMPYEAAEPEDLNRMTWKVDRMPTGLLYGTEEEAFEAIGEKYCDGPVCEL